MASLQSVIPFTVFEQVAELLVRRGQKEAVALVKLVLWVLATRLGTLVLCGSLSLSWRFPFINKFSDMPVEKREHILMKWNREKSFIFLRLVFVIVKVFCLYVFYSMVNVPPTLLVSSFQN